MGKTIRLGGILGLIALGAAAALNGTYKLTKPAIAQAAEREKAAALAGIFFNGFAKTVEKKAAGVDYYEIYLAADKDVPSFYALSGQGIGYNTTVPMVVLAGFANPKSTNQQIKKQPNTAAGKFTCVGWQLIQSAETPGLGENARDPKPAQNWLNLILGRARDTNPDRRTPFQKQFADKAPQEMVVKGNIDVLTGATYTTDGIVAALQDAEKRLAKALAE